MSGTKTDKLNGYNQPEEEEGLAVALFTCYDSAVSQANSGAVSVLLFTHSLSGLVFSCNPVSASTFPLHIASQCVDASDSSFRGNTSKVALQRVNIFLCFLLTSVCPFFFTEATISILQLCVAYTADVFYSKFPLVTESEVKALQKGF